MLHLVTTTPNSAVGKMNFERLHDAETQFLQRYPGGFDDPAIQSIKKKHNVDKLIEFSHESLTEPNCDRPEFVADSLLKIVSRSSMVSRFEKPRFRDFIRSLSAAEKIKLAHAIKNSLHGKKKAGFEEMLELLLYYKLAKWAIISVVPFYYSPKREVFVKPTTAKGIISYLEVGNLHYDATPSWSFYTGYRKLIAEIKKQVAPSLSPNNAALTGFMMMSL